MKQIVFYHKGCTDGAMAAGVFVHACDIDLFICTRFISMNFGEHPDISTRTTLMGGVSDVFFLDVLPDSKFVVELIDAGMSVTIIDHHKDGLFDLIDKLPVRITNHQKFKTHTAFEYVSDKVPVCGATLTWDYLLKDTPMHTAVEMIGYYDNHDRSAGDVPWMINDAMELIDLDSIADIREFIKLGIAETLDLGEKASAEKKERVESIVRSGDCKVINGVTFYMFDSPRIYRNDVATKVLETAKDAVVVVSQREENRYQHSLRTSKESGIDVNLIAKKMGGGGHPSAAGVISLLSFPELLELYYQDQKPKTSGFVLGFFRKLFK